MNPFSLLIKSTKRLVLAASYITSLPLAKLFKLKEEDYQDLSGLAKYLPTVGLLLGALLTVSCLIMTAFGVDRLLQAALLSVLWLMVTGALHMDGLMDTADGIFSHQNRDRMLAIMQDSRVGNFGALSGLSVFLLKFAALATMPEPSLPTALLLTPALGRLAEVYAIGRYEYAKPEGKGKIWHDSTRLPGDFILAIIFPAICALLLFIKGELYVLFLILAALICGLFFSAYLNRRLSGHTGDTYGAVVELTETGTLVLFTLTLSVMKKILL